MVIVPEIKTVVMQPPRTGSTSVRDAILKRYPRAFPLYRHMERSGIPTGYENWRVVCQVRNPIDRLRSVYRYMAEPILKASTDPEWFEVVKKETAVGFTDWLLRGHYPFANASSPHCENYRPYYYVNHMLPEQRKSQALYFNPDDDLIEFSTLAEDAARLLDIEVMPSNGSINRPTDIDRSDVWAHMMRWHEWDCKFYRLFGYAS